MCEKCREVIEKYFGELPDDFNLGFASEELIANILWCETAFPVCGPDTLDEQLAAIQKRDTARSHIWKTMR